MNEHCSILKQRSIRLVASLLLVTASIDTEAQNILDKYVKEGLESNESIHQQKLLLDKSMYALKEAKALFLPDISFYGDYFLAGGGRTIDFPAGDLLNNAYSTLNQLTNTNNFPQLENESILLNPNNFYEERLS